MNLNFIKEVFTLTDSDESAIIENCGDFYDELDGYYLVLKPNICNKMVELLKNMYPNHSSHIQSISMSEANMVELSKLHSTLEKVKYTNYLVTEYGSARKLLEVYGFIKPKSEEVTSTSSTNSNEIRDLIDDMTHEEPIIFKAVVAAPKDIMSGAIEEEEIGTFNVVGAVSTGTAKVVEVVETIDNSNLPKSEDIKVDSVNPKISNADFYNKMKDEEKIESKEANEMHNVPKANNTLENPIGSEKLEEISEILMDNKKDIEEIKEVVKTIAISQVSVNEVKPDLLTEEEIIRFLEIIKSYSAENVKTILFEALLKMLEKDKIAQVVCLFDSILEVISSRRDLFE